MSWTAPKTWAVGEVVTATNMNTHVRDNLKAIGDAWTTYAPAWTSSGTAPVIGNGTITGLYLQAGKLVIGRLTMVTGSTSTYGTGVYSWSLPVAAQPAGVSALLYLGVGAYHDASVPTRFPRLVKLVTATTVQLSDTSDTSVSQTVPATWASGDSISASFVYEAS